MLESIQAVSLLTIMEIVGPVLLLAVLIYGTLQWSRRRRGPTQGRSGKHPASELYREGAKAETARKKRQCGRRLVSTKRNHQDGASRYPSHPRETR